MVSSSGSFIPLKFFVTIFQPYVYKVKFDCFIDTYQLFPECFFFLDKHLELLILHFITFFSSSIDVLL